MTETDISKVLIEGEYATIMGVKYKRVEEPKSPVEEAYKEVFGKYPETGSDATKFDIQSWNIFQYGWNAAKEDRVVDEPDYYDEVECDEKDNPKPMDNVVDRMLKEWEENPPEFLKFELGKTLEALITRWWCDVFGGINQDWDMETAIADLCDQIELWLPKSQSASGSQSLGVEDMVEGFNDCLKKIKSKLRNKKI